MNITSHNEKSIKEIHSRIQFLVTVEIFFSTMIYAFYKSIGSDKVLANNNATLFLGIGVAFCIINYLAISSAKNVTERVLKWIRNTISLNIGLFILPMILFALIVRKPVSGYTNCHLLFLFMGVSGCHLQHSYLSVALSHGRKFAGYERYLRYKIYY